MLLAISSSIYDNYNNYYKQ